ncbi:MAG: PEP-CTERM sorting domain-containing protein, partial [Planctomycetes bacterium]|nr:PEP-CTERM sorting domain-containing protein [Planctomycetota bacterium]
SLAVPEPSTMIGSLLMFSVFGAVWARKRFAA